MNLNQIYAKFTKLLTGVEGMYYYMITLHICAYHRWKIIKIASFSLVGCILLIYKL